MVLFQCNYYMKTSDLQEHQQEFTDTCWQFPSGVGDGPGVLKNKQPPLIYVKINISCYHLNLYLLLL